MRGKLEGSTSGNYSAEIDQIPVEDEEVIWVIG